MTPHTDFFSKLIPYHRHISGLLQCIRDNFPPLVSTITMSFGFSPGDVLIVVKFAFNVCATVREFPNKHADLVLQLAIFRQSLEDIDLSTASEAAKKQYFRCSQLLQKLDETATKYQKNTLSSGVQGGKAKASLRQLKWGVYGGEKLGKSLNGFRDEFDLLFKTYVTFFTSR